MRGFGTRSRRPWLWLMTAGTLAAPQALAGQAREAEVVDSILALMTLEEKLGQLTQWTGSWSQGGPTTVTTRGNITRVRRPTGRCEYGMRMRRSRRLVSSRMIGGWITGTRDM